MLLLLLSQLPLPSLSHCGHHCWCGHHHCIIVAAAVIIAVLLPMPLQLPSTAAAAIAITLQWHGCCSHHHVWRITLYSHTARLCTRWHGSITWSRVLARAKWVRLDTEGICLQWTVKGFYRGLHWCWTGQQGASAKLQKTCHFWTLFITFQLFNKHTRSHKLKVPESGQVV